MKRFIVTFFCIITCISSLFSQNSSSIDSISIEKIDCRNPIGHINLKLSSNWIIGGPEFWEYQPYDSTSWFPIDSTTFLSSSFDTLSTSTCGKYRVEIIKFGGIDRDTVIFFVPCKVTLGF